MDAADNIVDNFPANFHLADSDEEGAGFAGDGRESDDESADSFVTAPERDDDDGPIVLNVATLPLIKRKDPNITSVLFDGEVSEGVDWIQNAIPFIGNNPHLTQVSMCNITDAGNWNFAAFCEGVSLNTSIETLRISQCSLGGVKAEAALGNLSPLFEGGNLRTLEIAERTLLPEGQLASFMKKCHSLENVRICNCCLLSIAKPLLEALDDKESLRKIELKTEEFRNRGMSWGAWDCSLLLGNLLQSPKCAVAEVSLQMYGIDKTCLVFLASSLAKNKSLVKLNLSGNTPLDPNDWCAFATSLQKHRFFSLEELDLSENAFNDEALAILGSAVGSSTKPVSLLLRNNSEMVSQGAWGSFLSTVASLAELDISGNPIGNGPLLGLADVLANNTTLRRLCMSGTGIGDDGAIALKNGLLTNSTLEDLDLSLNAGTGERCIGERSLKAFCELLCNPSSIDDTYASNHTLLPEMSCDDLGLAAKLAGLRMTNRGFDTKREVARHKVIHTHLINRHGRVNVDAFLDMEFGVLPRAMAWVGRERDRNVVAARRSFSVLYKLLLALPSLFEVRAAECKKRKRGV